MKQFTFLRSSLTVLALASTATAQAQAPAWQTAVAAASSSVSTGRASAVDASGNIFVVGSFTGTIGFGSTTLASVGNPGTYDAFVAKWSPSSQTFVWALRMGGTDDEGANAVAVSGNAVYVAGAFNSSTAAFGSFTLANPNNANGNNGDVFVTKIADAGGSASFAWASRAGGTGTDKATALAISGANVYVAGAFTSTLAAFGSTTLASAGGYDVFVSKLTDTGSSGTFAWTQRAGSTGADAATALAVQGNSVYVAGDFAGTSVAFGSISLTSAGYDDGFVAKLTDAGTTGNFTWTQRVGGAFYDHATALAVAGTTVYLAGYFQSTNVQFGSTTLSANGYDVYVTKLTDAGTSSTFIWAQKAGGNFNDEALAVAVNGTSIYVAGRFDSTPARFGSNAVTAAGGYDLFVAKLTDAGTTATYAWAQRAGGSFNDVVTGLAVDGPRVHVTGSLSAPASFGSVVVAAPNNGAFVASLVDGPLATAVPIGAVALHLFPNPAHGTATVHLPASSRPGSLALLDALGREVRRYPAPAGTEATLDLRGLPAGVYVLRHGSGSQRLVVE